MSDVQRPTTFRVPTGPGEVVRRYWLRLLVLVVALAIGVQWFRLSFYDTGYAPEQPIAFPHNRHAGELGIDCKYCHFNATRGKHAGVPPMSVCLGCHGPMGGQIANDKPGVKLLLQVAENGGYISDASGRILPDKAPKDAKDAPAGSIVHEGGVIHWNRVHKLPDFVYFPHRWHIAANVACQTCHGPVETMPVVRQYADLTMGWCLECHRRSNYVGGRDFVAGKPETFTVGTSNYEVARARIAEDDVVLFEPRDTKAHPYDPKAAESASAPKGGETSDQAREQYTAKIIPSSGGRPQAYEAAMRQLVADHPALRDAPPWRLVDLPETHQKIYRELVADDVRDYKATHDGQAPSADDERDFFLRRSFMNSPTNCSTCHQ